jgi:hypothetical protein
MTLRRSVLGREMKGRRDVHPVPGTSLGTEQSDAAHYPPPLHKTSLSIRDTSLGHKADCMQKMPRPRC